jgi:hypothetical protein
LAGWLFGMKLSPKQNSKNNRANYRNTGKEYQGFHYSFSNRKKPIKAIIILA